MQRTSVIIPAYNEEKEISNVILGVKKYCRSVIVIDDGSSDDTCTKAIEAGAELLRHPVNLGKGAALKTGCEYALKHGATKIICIDSDGQHDPKHVPEIEGALDKYDIVFTYRTFNKKMPMILRIGNMLITTTSSVLSRLRLNDPLCGYRGLTQKGYEQVRWITCGYFVEEEMVLNAAGLKYTELPIATIYKDSYKGTNVLDGISIMSNMIVYRLLKWI